MTRTAPSARTCVATTAVAALVLLTGCGGDSMTDPSAAASPAAITVGAGTSAVDRVLAEVYAGALRRGGGDASVAPVSGGVEEIGRGTVDLLPGFTGALLAESEPGADARTSDEVYEALARSLPEWLSVSDYAAAEDRETVLASESTADVLESGSIADLAASCGDRVVTVVGVDPADALAPFADTYGCTFAAVVPSTDAASARSALASGGVDVAVVRGTDLGAEDSGSGAAAERTVTLDDSENAFTAQNVVPVFRKGLLSERQSTVLGVVAGELTTADLADMVFRVREGEPAAWVADAWLAERTF